MTGLRVLWRRLCALFRTGNLECDLEDEFDFHLHMEIAENLRRGMTPPQARLAALRRFGDSPRSKRPIGKLGGCR